MDALLLADSAIELFGKPRAIAMAGRRVQSVWINLCGQDSEITESTAGLLARRFEDRA